jgi:hypothetical protein
MALGCHPDYSDSFCHLTAQGSPSYDIFLFSEKYDKCYIHRMSYVKMKSHFVSEGLCVRGQTVMRSLMVA